MKKGRKPLKTFDAKNIAGRAGRFLQHYVGRVIAIDNDFEDLTNGKDELLNHKNYDKESIKTDVDYQITEDQYLSKEDRQKKEEIESLIEQSRIPREVFNAFKIVSPISKLELYHRILQLSNYEIQMIKNLSHRLAYSNASALDWDGFQLIMDIIQPIVKREEALYSLIETKRGNTGKYSVITTLIYSYLQSGFIGMRDYYTKNKNMTNDKAIRRASDYVYNVFKYHLVKYLGLFDGFYRYVISTRTGQNKDDIAGLGSLLQKLEYNAITPQARRLSDFGVPFKLVDYYDKENPTGTKSFDAYEQYIDSKIQNLLL